ncbi:hypothetical protein BESB_085460 [Besnoitia besnoiti]|uniref:HEAT repeat-containing protein n=1 Tax=Besnoitia besnoiti TaxID=94643 RepID=A0A2A9MCM6_BESBE|nr:hypothetical protein BESB_085460 [Besnoitia besnoiti]PFH33347.1 hypothetical protein BESB_085460 [Besnoitia besnoiti]
MEREAEVADLHAAPAASSSPAETAQPLVLPSRPPPAATYADAVGAVLSLAGSENSGALGRLLLPATADSGTPSLARRLSSPDSREREPFRTPRARTRSVSVPPSHDAEGLRDAYGDEQRGCRSGSRALSEAIETLGFLPFRRAAMQAVERVRGTLMPSSAPFLGAEDGGDGDTAEDEGGSGILDASTQPKATRTRLGALKTLSDVALDLIERSEEDISLFWSSLAASASDAAALAAATSPSLVSSSPDAAPGVSDVLRETLSILVKEGKGEEGELAALLYLRMMLWEGGLSYHVAPWPELLRDIAMLLERRLPLSSSTLSGASRSPLAPAVSSQASSPLVAAMSSPRRGARPRATPPRRRSARIPSGRRRGRDDEAAAEDESASSDASQASAAGAVSSDSERKRPAGARGRRGDSARGVSCRSSAAETALLTLAVFLRRLPLPIFQSVAGREALRGCLQALLASVTKRGGLALAHRRLVLRLPALLLARAHDLRMQHAASSVAGGPFLLLPLYEGGPQVDVFSAAASDAFLLLLPVLLHAAPATAALPSVASAPASAPAAEPAFEVQREGAHVVRELIEDFPLLVAPDVLCAPELLAVCRAREREAEGGDEARGDRQAATAAEDKQEEKKDGALEERASSSPSAAAFCDAANDAEQENGSADKEYEEEENPASDAEDAEDAEEGGLRKRPRSGYEDEEEDEKEKRRRDASDAVVSLMGAVSYASAPSSTSAAAPVVAALLLILRASLEAEKTLQRLLPARFQIRAALVAESLSHRDDAAREAAASPSFFDRFLARVLLPALRSERAFHRLLAVEFLQSLLALEARRLPSPSSLPPPAPKLHAPADAEKGERDQELHEVAAAGAHACGDDLPLLSLFRRSEKQKTADALIEALMRRTKDCQSLLRSRGIDVLGHLISALLRHALAASGNSSRASASGPLRRSLSRLLHPPTLSTLVSSCLRDSRSVIRQAALTFLRRLLPLLLSREVRARGCGLGAWLSQHFFAFFLKCADLHRMRDGGQSLLLHEQMRLPGLIRRLLPLLALSLPPSQARFLASAPAPSASVASLRLVVALLYFFPLAETASRCTDSSLLVRRQAVATTHEWVMTLFRCLVCLSPSVLSAAPPPLAEGSDAAPGGANSLPKAVVNGAAEAASPQAKPGQAPSPASLSLSFASLCVPQVVAPPHASSEMPAREILAACVGDLSQAWRDSVLAQATGDEEESVRERASEAVASLLLSCAGAAEGDIRERDARDGASQQAAGRKRQRSCGASEHEKENLRERAGNEAALSAHVDSDEADATGDAPGRRGDESDDIQRRAPQNPRASAAQTTDDAREEREEEGEEEDVTGEPTAWCAAQALLRDPSEEELEDILQFYLNYLRKHGRFSREFFSSCLSRLRASQVSGSLPPPTVLLALQAVLLHAHPQAAASGASPSGSAPSTPGAALRREDRRFAEIFAAEEAKLSDDRRGAQAALALWLRLFSDRRGEPLMPAAAEAEAGTGDGKRGGAREDERAADMRGEARPKPAADAEREIEESRRQARGYLASGVSRRLFILLEAAVPHLRPNERQLASERLFRMIHDFDCAASLVPAAIAACFALRPRPAQSYEGNGRARPRPCKQEEADWEEGHTKGESDRGAAQAASEDLSLEPQPRGHWTETVLARVEGEMRRLLVVPSRLASASPPALRAAEKADLASRDGAEADPEAEKENGRARETPPRDVAGTGAPRRPEGELSAVTPQAADATWRAEEDLERLARCIVTGGELALLRDVSASSLPSMLHAVVKNRLCLLAAPTKYEAPGGVETLVGSAEASPSAEPPARSPRASAAAEASASPHSSAAASGGAVEPFLALPLRVRALAVQALGKVALSRTAGGARLPSAEEAPQQRSGADREAGAAPGDEVAVTESLGALLSEQEHPILRMSALAVISDLMQRQTGVADRFVPRIVAALASQETPAHAEDAPCREATSPAGERKPAKRQEETPKDENLFVPLRKIALTCLSTLVAEEFIKFKGHTVHGMLYALGDSHAEIRGIAEAVFLRVILPRYEGRLPALFVECLIAFNGFYAHPAFTGKATLRALCCRANHDKKSRIYRFILDRVSSLTKYRIQQRLVSSMLTAWIDDKPQLPLTSSVPSSLASASALPLPQRFADADGALLSDTLRLLACPALKVKIRKAGPLRGVEPNDEENEGDDPAGDDEERKAKRSGKRARQAGNRDQAGPASMGELLDLMVKKVLQTEVIPVLRSLDVLMRAKFSPFQEELLTAFCEVLQDYWDDLEEMLGEASLAKELRHFAQTRQLDPSSRQPKSSQGSSEIAEVQET